MELTVSLPEEEHSIPMITRPGSSRILITTTAEYHACVAVSYINALHANIRQRLSNKAVKMLAAMSIFYPSLLPKEDSLVSYGNEHIKVLADFYGKAAEVEHPGVTHTSLPLPNGDELLSEWKMFRRAMAVEKDAIMQS